MIYVTPGGAQPSIPPAMFSFGSAVAYTGLSLRNLHRLHSSGRLKFTKVGRRTYLKREELDRLIASFPTT